MELLVSRSQLLWSILVYIIVYVKLNKYNKAKLNAS